MTTKALKQKSVQVSPIAWLVLAVVALGGIGWAWSTQMTNGMAVTGLNRQVVWGLYIAGFFTAMGAGAGLTALAGIGEFAPQISVARRRSTLMLALASFVASGVLIAMDLGNPVNLLRIVTAAKFNSMMTWDFWALMGVGLIALVYLVVVWKQAKSTVVTKVIGAIAIVGALALVLIEAWMLALLSAHPFFGGLTVVNFVVAALVAGMAIAMLAWGQEAKKLAPWLILGLMASLVIALAEVFTSLFSGAPRAAQEAGVLVFGSQSSLFWLQIVVGAVLPLAILAWSRDLVWLRVAAGLAVVGVIAEKLWQLVAGQAVPWLPLAEGRYAPTNVEYLGVVGAIALAALVYLAVSRLAKLEDM